MLACRSIEFSVFTLPRLVVSSLLLIFPCWDMLRHQQYSFVKSFKLADWKLDRTSGVIVFHFLVMIACLPLLTSSLPIPSPATVGCRDNTDCPSDLACYNKECLSPCTYRNSCESSERCEVRDHIPFCISGMSSSPFPPPLPNAAKLTQLSSFLSRDS